MHFLALASSLQTSFAHLAAHSAFVDSKKVSPAYNGISSSTKSFEFLRVIIRTVTHAWETFCEGTNVLDRVAWPILSLWLGHPML